MPAPSPALLVPPVRLGRLLRDAREAHGETIPELVRRSGLAYDNQWFDALEAGHVALDESLVRWASALYGVGASEVVPARSQLVIDLDEGVIAVGARRSPLVGPAPAASGFDQVLGNYLALVYLLRDLPAGTPIPVREVDITVLAQALQRDRREVRAALGRLISTDGDALAQRSSSLRRRVIVPVAGILVGLTAVGGLLLVRASGSEARADDGPATEEGPAVTARDVPVDIGDAVVLERGEAQTLASPACPRGARAGRLAGVEPEARRWSVVSGLIEDAEGLLLVANRRRSGSVDWSPPGGVVDPGEALLGALTREVVEETGLRVHVWEGPVYEITVDFGARGGELTVAVYRALEWSGEIVLDDPDGIVHEAAFHEHTACHDRLASAPEWVAGPLIEWLSERWTAGRSYAYRVVGGNDLASLVVERL